MTTLLEVRQRYPEFNDRSDEELTQALHHIYQTDTGEQVPFDVFSQEIGYRPLVGGERRYSELADMQPTTGTFKQRPAPPVPNVTKDQPLTPETPVKRASWEDVLTSPTQSWPDIARSMVGGVLYRHGEDVRRTPVGLTEDKRVKFEMGPLPEYAKVGRGMYENAQRAIMSKRPEDMGGFQELIYDTQMMLYRMGPVFAGGLASQGKALPALLPMFVQVRGERYSALRQNGMPHEEAALHADMAALIETGTELIPIGWMMKRGSPFVKRIIQGTIGEGAQESVSSLLQSAWDKGTIDPDMTWQEALRAAGYEGAIGTLGGATMSAAFHPFFRELKQAEQNTPNYPKWQTGKAEIGKLWPDMVTISEQDWSGAILKSEVARDNAALKQGFEEAPKSLGMDFTDYAGYRSLTAGNTQAKLLSMGQRIDETTPELKALATKETYTEGEQARWNELAATQTTVIDDMLGSGFSARDMQLKAKQTRPETKDRIEAYTISFRGQPLLEDAELIYRTPEYMRDALHDAYIEKKYPVVGRAIKYPKYDKPVAEEKEQAVKLTAPVLGTMRRLGELQLMFMREAKKGTPQNGRVALGSEYVRNTANEQALFAFLQTLREEKGSLADAEIAGKEAGRKVVENFNARNKDPYLKLNEDTVDSMIESAKRDVYQAAQVKADVVDPKAEVTPATAIEQAVKEWQLNMDEGVQLRGTPEMAEIGAPTMPPVLTEGLVYLNKLQGEWAKKAKKAGPKSKPLQRAKAIMAERGLWKMQQVLRDGGSTKLAFEEARMEAQKASDFFNNQFSDLVDPRRVAVTLADGVFSKAMTELNKIVPEEVTKPEDWLGETDMTVEPYEEWDIPVGEFDAPPTSTNFIYKLGKDYIPLKEAKGKLAEWKKEAKRIGKQEDHSKEIIISLFDWSGKMSEPWRDAGYTVEQFDLELGDDLFSSSPLNRENMEYDDSYTVVGILAQPPCTCFSSSAAQWWETRHDKKDVKLVNKMFGPEAANWFERPVDYTKMLVSITDVWIDLNKQDNPNLFYMLENPVGRIAEETGLPEATIRFQPHNFGDPYTKQTGIWGRFNTELPTANVYPSKGSLMHKMWSTAEKEKGLRSLTPEGFAYAFFMANNTSAQKAAAEPYAMQEVKVGPKQVAQIANLRKVADNMQKQIDNKLDPATAHQNMTPRRIRIAEGMRQDGEQMQRVQNILRGVADNLEAGTLPSELAGVKNKKTAALLESYGNPERGDWARDWNRVSDEAKTTFERAGIHKINYTSALDAAWSYVQGVSPEQAKATELRKLEQSLVGTKIAGFFPTPTDTVNALVDKADIQPDDTVLEPSAGSGNIADVIKERHPENKLTVNEINYTLNNILSAKGYDSTQNDFLDMEGAFDKIIMNPPFEKLQDIDHVRHAYEMLAPNGRLVSIMSPAPFQRDTKKAKAFREWFDDVGGVVEDLEAGTFNKAELVRTTGVSSKVVTIDKPAHQGTQLYSNPVQPMIEGYAQVADKTVQWLENKFAPWSALGRLPNQNVYLKKRYRTLGRLSNLNEVATKISTIFDKANEIDHANVYAYLTNKDGDASTILDPVIQRHAIAVKKLINKTGRALVNKGVIPEESFDKYAGQYLPRVYLKYLLGEEAFRSLGIGAKISEQGYAKQRKDIPEDVRKVVLGEITDPAYLAARAVTVPARDMAIMEFLEDLSHYKEWVLPKNVANIVVDENFRVTRVPDRSRTPHKRVSAFWLKNEAERLAEQALHMPEETAVRTRQMAKDYADIANEMFGEQQAIPDNYKQVPNTARYGALRGLYVRKEIYDDLIGTGQVTGEAGSFAERLLGQGGYATKATQAWKMSKVALNYPTQVRNFVSNGILLQLSGVPLHKVPVDVIKAIEQMRTNGKYYRIAKKYGVKAASFSHNELLRIERHMLQVKAANEGRFGIHHLLDMGAAFLNFHGDVYQLSESVFKTAKIIDAMEREGMSESDAVMAAQEALFDYSLIPQNIRFLRNNPIGIPFATFYYKATAQLVKTAIKNPARFAPYVALNIILREMVQSMGDLSDDDYETLKLSLPQWLQERGGAYFLPVKDEHGRWQAVSVGYFFPWQMHVEFINEMKSTLKGEPQAGEILQTTGLLGGPIPELIAAIKTGKDSFTGKDIINDTDMPSKKAADLMSYLWRLSMPTYMTDMGAIGHTLKALDGYKDPRKVFYGDPKYTTSQALARFLGVNIYPVDPEKSRANNLRQMKFEILDLKKRYIQLMRDPNITDEERQRNTKWYTDEMAVRALQLEEYAIKTERADKL